MREFLLKNKGIILYVVFGVLTTVINIACYAVCYNYLGISNVLSNIIAWILSVAFAFITNKLWVFDSKSLRLNIVLSELWKFVSCRLATGVLDIFIMYIGVDVLHGPSLLLKISSNALVIVLNYIASKILIFTKK